TTSGARGDLPVSGALGLGAGAAGFAGMVIAMSLASRRTPETRDDQPLPNVGQVERRLRKPMRLAHSSVISATLSHLATAARVSGPNLPSVPRPTISCR